MIVGATEGCKRQSLSKGWRKLHIKTLMGYSPVFIMPNASLPYIILLDWNQNVKVYLEIVIPKGIPEKDRPQTCPLCGQSERLPQRHGHFTRTIFSLMEPQGIEIPIFRFLCLGCDDTFSIIPSFIEKNHQMALDIKEKVIRERAEGATLPDIEQATTLLPGGRYSAKTIRRWTKVWNERLCRLQAEVWNWLLKRLPHLCFPKGDAGSLWLVFFELWEQIRQKFNDWSNIRFLHFLNRLAISVAVTGQTSNPTKDVRQ